MNIEICKALSNNLGLLFSCSQVGELTQVRTPYLFPDGDIIDLFCKSSQGKIIVTDMGETLRWLMCQTGRDWFSESQNRAMEDIALTHDVELYKSAIIARANGLEEVAESLTKVGQSSIAISNLWFLSQRRIMSSLQEEMAELLRERQIRFIENQKLTGRSNRSWRVNFQTWHEEHSSLVQILSTGNRSAANRQVNRVVSGWVDLQSYKASSTPFRFVSLFDDTTDVWNSASINQVNEFSDIAFLSEPNHFIELLTTP